MADMLYEGKRILITQNRLWNFAGSEITTLELAEFFSDNGAYVNIFCLGFGEPILSEFNKIERVSLTADPGEFSFSRFDIVWVQHQILPETMLQELSNGIELPIVIFHHMSSVEPLELPFIRGLEESIASLSLFNSKKTMEIQRPLFNQTDYSSFQLFANPVPPPFLKEPKRNSRHLAKVAVISNHPPVEISETAKLLREAALSVDFIGDGYRFVRVTPALLSEYDAIVSIGKTCQYALVMGISVYCYDHFGGPGYLSDAVYEKAANFHFSGKGFKRKPPGQIYHELTDDYYQATLFSRSIRDQARIEYSMERNLKRVIGGTARRGYVKLDPSEIKLYLAIRTIVEREVRSYYTILAFQQLRENHRRLQKTSQAALESNRKLSRQLKEHINEKKAFRSRKSIRIGLLIARFADGVRNLISNGGP